MQRLDTIIVKHIINEALKSNNTISVNDGEDWCVRRSRNPKEVFDALESTDSDQILIRDENRELLGSVYLVHGNEDGVIVSDHSDRPYINEIVEAAITKSEDA